MKTITFIGYYKKPFDFCYITDRMLLEAMASLNNDRFILCDWNDLNPELKTKESFDWKKQKKIKHDLTKTDVAVILEIPTKTSTHTTLDHVTPILKQMRKLSIPGVNPAATFLEMKDKSYFFEFPQLPFPLTRKVDSYSDLERILKEFPNEIIIKPIDTDGGYGVTKLENNYEKVKEHIKNNKKDGPFLLQEFVQEITEGERSIFFFGKKFRYAMLKKPSPGQYRCNEDNVTLTRYYPTEKELKTAEEAIEIVKSPSVLERIDLTSSGKIMELTLDCPGLYLVEANIQDKIGKWFYEAINAVIKNFIKNT